MSTRIRLGRQYLCLDPIRRRHGSRRIEAPEPLNRYLSLKHPGALTMMDDRFMGDDRSEQAFIIHIGQYRPGSFQHQRYMLRTLFTRTIQFLCIVPPSISYTLLFRFLLVFSHMQATYESLFIPQSPQATSTWLISVVYATMSQVRVCLWRKGSSVPRLCVCI